MKYSYVKSGSFHVFLCQYFFSKSKTGNYFLAFKHHKTFLLRFSPLIKIGRKKAEVKGQGDDSQEYLQHAEFVNSETEEEGVGVIFVTENNIYHQPDLTNRDTE